MLRLLTAGLLICQAVANFPILQNKIEKEGLHAEKHDVYTEDGWRLSMIRIYKCGDCETKEVLLTDTSKNSETNGQETNSTATNTTVTVVQTNSTANNNTVETIGQ